MRTVREWWRRLRGWWLLALAALAAVGKVYTGLVAAVLVAIGGGLAVGLVERGKTHLAERAKTAAFPRSRLFVRKVNKIGNPRWLGVHPAAELDGDRTPPFIARDRMPDLENAVNTGGFVLVIGDSTAGKTRMAYEAMRARLPRHVCVVPEPDALAAGCAAATQNRPSVLWLDDLERFLGGLGGTYLADLLDAGVLVLATMRAHERDELSARHDAGREQSDRQSARTGRAVLNAVTTEIRIERMWSAAEVAAAREFADDPRVASAGKHGLAETMAAGPQLAKELEDAWSARSEIRGAALVTAAVDVRLAGYHRPLPIDFLRSLHEHYVAERPLARPGTWENALAWATQPLHATSSLLGPAGDDRYLAFDYLVDAAARNPHAAPIPAATWLALIEHADADDITGIAWQATYDGRPGYVSRAFDRAMAERWYVAAAWLAVSLGEAGQESTAVDLLESAIRGVENSEGVPARDLLDMRRQLAWQVGQKYGATGDPERALKIIRQVERDCAALFGEAHPDTFSARVDLARQLGGMGASQDALALAKGVVAQSADALGPDHEITRRARFETAVWTRVVEGPAVGAQLFRELLEDSDGWDLDVAWNLGGALVDAGEPAAAVEVLAELVRKSGVRLGEDYANTH